MRCGGNWNANYSGCGMKTPANPASRRESWRFDDGAPIAIICSELTKSDEGRLGPLSDVDNPNYTRLFSFADADALVDLIGT